MLTATASSLRRWPATGRKMMSATLQHGLQTVDRQWLWLLLAADLAFVALHVYRKVHGSGWMLDISNDGGYAEMFQYLKEFWIALLLARAAMLRRDRWLWLWSAVFAYVLLDDAASLHERAGNWLAAHGGVGAAYGAEAKDIGQLLFFACAASACAGAVIALRRFMPAPPMAPHKALLLLFAGLVFFGVGVDLLHSILAPLGVRGLGVIEDGGEMLVMSAVAAYAAGLVRRPA
jgi:hypothetical protein